jgi:nucleotide-binding universal stress UspA family protein
MGERSTVVVGVDGSPESRVALRFALEDAARRGALLQVVTAYVSPEYWAAAYGLSALPTVEEVVGEHEAVAREAVDAVVADEPALADVPSRWSPAPGRRPGRSSTRPGEPSCSCWATAGVAASPAPCWARSACSASCTPCAR